MSTGCVSQEMADEMSLAPKIVFKALFPLTAQWLDFKDACIVFVEVYFWANTNRKLQGYEIAPPNSFELYPR